MEEEFISMVLRSHRWEFRFIMRVPNPLNLTKIEDCPFFEDFMEFDGSTSNLTVLNEMKYLRGLINAYVRDNILFCDIECTKPMFYIMII